MVTLESIKNTFKRMEDDGVNTKIELLWGYFFTNNMPEQLEEIANKLNKQGYKKVEIYQDINGLYWLNLEKVGVHTPESLFAICEKFNQLAQNSLINSFDGYDVGNPEKGKPITEVK